MSTTFSVIKKSAGYSVKTLMSEEKARKFAADCNRIQNCDNFIVCIWKDGMFVEI